VAPVCARAEKTGGNGRRQRGRNRKLLPDRLVNPYKRKEKGKGGDQHHPGTDAEQASEKAGGKPGEGEGANDESVPPARS